eukprot:CAMPEP_0185688738 /NCGR_PEP_ID=MMETSP1164-20130828/21_1 /TAXON_ID=1104430 /ORGANISM="Chrysoreinhardia sp, Strain CCMP2950" /LENGTH=259 /DNA_ID=CAMNT_0028355197 /DNA_START=102 /DNA_END=883 /DNA_ORIENTATION=+
MVQLVVRLPGAGGARVVEADPALTIAGVKEMIEDEEFIPAEIQRLVSGTKRLTVGTLEDNGLEDGAEVELLLDVVGGGEASRYKKSTSRMRWKWKKKRTRRLQRKRRKMRARAKERPTLPGACLVARDRRVRTCRTRWPPARRNLKIDHRAGSSVVSLAQQDHDCEDTSDASGVRSLRCVTQQLDDDDDGGDAGCGVRASSGGTLQPWSAVDGRDGGAEGALNVKTACPRREVRDKRVPRSLVRRGVRSPSSDLQVPPL